jgi:hypothetical protein
MISKSDTSAQTGNMMPASESKKSGLSLNLPRVENDMLSVDQKKQLKKIARGFGKNPDKLIQSVNDLAKKIQHYMMIPEERGHREREEGRKKSSYMVLVNRPNQLLRTENNPNF